MPLHRPRSHHMAMLLCRTGSPAVSSTMVLSHMQRLHSAMCRHPERLARVPASAITTSTATTRTTSQRRRRHSHDQPKHSSNTCAGKGARRAQHKAAGSTSTRVVSHSRGASAGGSTAGEAVVPSWLHTRVPALPRAFTNRVLDYTDVQVGCGVTHHVTVSC